MMQTKEINDYRGLGRAIVLSDSRYKLIVTLDIGPRILWFSTINGDNVLADDVQETETLPDGSEWHLYGGHRIWYSPELFPRTYLSDSHPVEKFEMMDSGVSIIQKPEKETQIQKGLQIRFKEDFVEIENQIKNCGVRSFETAVWAITVVPPGGHAVCPVVKRDTGLLPNACYVTWPYTRLNDERVNWGEKNINIFADSKTEDEFKFGYSNYAGWISYIKDADMFLKQYVHKSESQYPDLGCSTEVYTSYFGLEMETLSPLGQLEPDQIFSHTEYWHIKSTPEINLLDEIDFKKFLINDLTKE